MKESAFSYFMFVLGLIICILKLFSTTTTTTTNTNKGEGDGGREKLREDKTMIKDKKAEPIDNVTEDAHLWLGRIGVKMEERRGDGG